MNKCDRLKSCVTDIRVIKTFLKSIYFVVRCGRVNAEKLGEVSWVMSQFLFLME